METTKSFVHPVKKTLQLGSTTRSIHGNFQPLPILLFMKLLWLCRILCPLPLIGVVNPAPIEIAESYCPLFWKRYGGKRIRMLCRRWFVFTLSLVIFLIGCCVSLTECSRIGMLRTKERRESPFYTATGKCRSWADLEYFRIWNTFSLFRFEDEATNYDGCRRMDTASSHSTAATLEELVCPCALSVVWQT